MTRKASIRPTADNNYRIIYTETTHEDGYDFSARLRDSRKAEEEGDIEGACNIRFEAFQQLMEFIPDSTDLELDWNDPASRDAILIISFSAIDHFLIGDFEMSAAMLEMQLELDPEDHLEGSTLLAYNYVALGEWELFDEVINDIGDKTPDKVLLQLWSGFRREGKLPEGELRRWRGPFAVYSREFSSQDHPADEPYLRDIAGERPSKEALARELWLQTEHLWKIHPDFITALTEAHA